jgi:hypothetical protein
MYPRSHITRLQIPGMAFFSRTFQDFICRKQLIFSQILVSKPCLIQRFSFPYFPKKGVEEKALAAGCARVAVARWVQAAEKAMSQSHVMARGFHMFLPHLLNCSQLYTLSISQLYSQLFHLPPLISVLVDCCFDLEKCGGQRSKQRGKYKPRCMVVFLGD